MRLPHVIRSIRLALALSFTLLLFSCTETESLSPEPKATGKKVTIAVDATFVPMSFKNDQGQLSGFEVELIQAVAKQAGYDYELVNVEWGGLFGGLIAGKFDLLISSITILEERKKRMAFSIPYLESGAALLVHNKASHVESLQAIQAEDGIVGAQINTTSYFHLEKYPDISKKGYEKFAHAVTDLANEKIIAVLGDTTQVNYFFNTDNSLKKHTRLVGQRLTSESYGIVFRKDNPELIDNFNLALGELLKNGTVKRLRDKWNLGEFATVPAPPDAP